VPATISPQRVNGIDFHVEQTGSGDPLVLIHGGWGSTARWALIVDGLAETFGVVNYDRRGHGHSGHSATPATRIEQEDDLAGIIEGLGIVPANLVGSSFGGAMALSLAARRPDLVRSVSVHEPPLVGLARDDEDARRAVADMQAIAAKIGRGERRAAAREFVERIALGPGGWDLLPDEVKDAMVRHASTFAGEMGDPAWTEIDLADIRCPIQLTMGDRSPAWFTPVMEALMDALPQAEAVTILGSGHIPHVTHAAEYTELVTRFAAGADEA
jgi:pimeloyl-ACP methyl ester carboxylesterase